MRLGGGLALALMGRTGAKADALMLINYYIQVMPYDLEADLVEIKASETYTE